MQKRILTGLTMLMLITAVALMAALVSAHAQTSRQIVADVPFDFAVGGKSLKAGEYSVKRFTTSGDTVLISNKASHESVVRITNTIQSGIVPKQAKLVFHRYGQRYFLSEIWTTGDQTGRQLLKSSEERAVEKQLAAIPSKSELAQHRYERVEILAAIR